MALSNGYGVVIGTIATHYIESPDSEGRWPHYVIKVNTPQGIYECVINLKSRTEIKIAYRDFRSVNKVYFQNILSLPDGFHSLSSIPLSGALDYKTFWTKRSFLFIFNMAMVEKIPVQATMQMYRMVA